MSPLRADHVPQMMVMRTSLARCVGPTPLRSEHGGGGRLRERCHGLDAVRPCSANHPVDVGTVDAGIRECHPPAAVRAGLSVHHAGDAGQMQRRGRVAVPRQGSGLAGIEPASTRTQAPHLGVRVRRCPGLVQATADACRAAVGHHNRRRGNRSARAHRHLSRRRQATIERIASAAAVAATGQRHSNRQHGGAQDPPRARRHSPPGTRGGPMMATVGNHAIGDESRAVR